MHTSEEILRSLYDALNRNDVPGVLAFLHPKIERMEPVGFPSSGIYRGHAALEEHIRKARATWAEGACTPERFVATGEKIVVFVHVHVRLRDKTDWINAHIADGYALQDGKVVEWRTFVEASDALAWAGLTPDA